MRGPDVRGQMGILDMLGLATVLIFALPAAILGVQFLLEGRTLLGGVLVVVAALMVLLQRVVTTPGDLPGKLAGMVVGTAVTDPESDADDGNGSRERE